jgi:hypothetical protein
MMIVMWLAVVVLLGITAIDAGSIAFTKFRLADVASTASTAAPTRSAPPEHRDRVSGGRGLHRGRGPLGEAGQEGVRRQHPDEHRDDHGPQGSADDHREHLGFTKKFTKVSATETNGPTAL